MLGSEEKSHQFVVDSKKWICFDCIGDKFLSNEIHSDGRDEDCFYCSKNNKSWPLEKIAKRVELALEQHYFQTSPNNERRTGDYLERTIFDLLKANDLPAKDVYRLISQCYKDQSPEGDVDRYSFRIEDPYSKKTHDQWVVDLKTEWHDFECHIKNKSRFFARKEVSVLESILGYLKTCSGKEEESIYRMAGPGFQIIELYRARILQSTNEILDALSRPDLKLGSPPASIAANGRINARGISVFYGALNVETALSEVRPPVGSKVALAKFRIVRTLKLLDLTESKKEVEQGSVFDQELAGRISHMEFLKFLGKHIDKPVIPNDQATEYLPTQALADFLSTRDELGIDGIIFPSVQSHEGGLNVVLFSKSSSVKKLEIAKDCTAREELDPMRGSLIGYVLPDEDIDEIESNNSESHEDGSELGHVLEVDRKSLVVKIVEKTAYSCRELPTYNG